MCQSFMEFNAKHNMGIPSLVIYMCLQCKKEIRKNDLSGIEDRGTEYRYYSRCADHKYRKRSKEI